jgi:hypothetical protein
LGENFSQKIDNIFPKIFAKIGVFCFRENFHKKYMRFSQNFSQRQKNLAKILSFCKNFHCCKNFCKILQAFGKNMHENENFSQNFVVYAEILVFAKIFTQNVRNFCENENFLQKQKFLLKINKIFAKTKKIFALFFCENFCFNPTPPHPTANYLPMLQRKTG